MKSFLLEDAKSREEVALDFLSSIIRSGPFKNKVFLAGGAVRDSVMGKPIKDIDVVVTMPDGGIEFAKWITQQLNIYREGSNPVVFPRFGTAKFNLRGTKHLGVDLSSVNIESVMTRGEKYTFGSRKPEVSYADLKEDAKRRDFTVNDLYKDLTTNQILDPTGIGFEDIKNGVVRTPVDPNITFKDDPLRMLRAVRFATKYNWKIAKSVLDALSSDSSMLQHISMERIQEEFNKMLMTDNPDVALKILSYTGLLREFLPEFDTLKGVEQNKYHKDDAFNHAVGVVKHTPKDLKARLAAVFHDIAKPLTKSVDPNGDIHFYDHEDVGAQIAQDVMQRMKYPNDMIQSVSNIVKNHMRLKGSGSRGELATDKTLRRFAATMGSDLSSALAMMHGDNLSHSKEHTMPDQIPALQSRIQQLAQLAPQKPKLPINGNDLMQTFELKPGPHLKKMLQSVEDAWFENPNLTRDQALAIAKSAYDDTAPDDILNRKIKNPETGNEILVKTALQYDDNHPARRAAEKLLKRKK